MTDVSHTAPTSRLAPLSRIWWSVLLRGIAAIVFGVLAFVWPGISLLSLVVVYGVYAIVDGVFALGGGMAGGSAAPRWWLVMVGLISLAAGVVALLWPGVTAVVLVLVIGSWAIAHGVIEIIGAIALRKEIENEWWLILSGLLSVVFGIFVILAPGAGALTLLWLIAIYAIGFGLLQVVLALRLRRLAGHLRSFAS